MSLSATAEAGARRARTTLELSADSMMLARDGWRELGGIVALGVSSGAALSCAGTLLAGFQSRETLALFMAGEAPLRVLPVAAAGILSRLIALYMTLALILACDARDRGAAIGVFQAWRRALAMTRAFLSALARVACVAAAGALLFIVPGMIALLRGAFCVHAAAIEGLDGRSAAARSRRLVRARPGYLLGNLLASSLLAGAGALLAISCLRVLMLAPTSVVPMSGGLLEYELVWTLDHLAAGLIGAWATAFSVLLYKDAAASVGAQ